MQLCLTYQFSNFREYSLSKEGNAHDGSVALSMGLGGFPSMAEEIFVQRAITVSKHLDAHIHLSSISSRGSVELIGKQKKRNSHYRRHHTCTP